MMLEIDGWKVGMKFSAAHFVPMHHKCSRLHGHDYGVKIRVYGEIKNSLLYDFVDIKKIVREICEEIDHHIILPKSNEYIESEIKENEVKVRFSGKEYVLPREDVVFMDIKVPTAEEISMYIAREIAKRIKFPENVKGLEICVEEGPGQGSWYYMAIGD